MPDYGRIGHGMGNNNASWISCAQWKPWCLSFFTGELRFRLEILKFLRAGGCEMTYKRKYDYVFQSCFPSCLYLRQIWIIFTHFWINQKWLPLSQIPSSSSLLTEQLIGRSLTSFKIIAVHHNFVVVIVVKSTLKNRKSCPKWARIFWKQLYSQCS